MKLVVGPLRQEIIPKKMDVLLAFGLLVTTAFVPAMTYRHIPILVSRPRLHDSRPTLLEKVWGGPVYSGTTEVQTSGNWSVDMPRRRLSGVRDNRFAAFQQPAQPFVSLGQTVVDPPSWSITTVPPGGDILQTHGDDAFGYEIAAGWPFLALYGAIIGQPPNPVTRVWALEVPISNAYTQQGRMIRSGRILPLRPVWPGFMLNLLFWTAVCTGLRVTSTQLRSRRYRLRGRCDNHACGYPLGDLSVCPECGKARPTCAASSTESVSRQTGRA